MVTLTKHVGKHKVRKLYLRHFLFFSFLYVNLFLSQIYKISPYAITKQSARAQKRIQTHKKTVKIVMTKQDLVLDF